jgi:hypothetical protein
MPPISTLENSIATLEAAFNNDPSPADESLVQSRPVARKMGNVSLDSISTLEAAFNNDPTPEVERVVDPTPMFDTDGSMNPIYNNVLNGPVGERLGYVQARDEGPLKEGAKGLLKGGVQFVEGVANTVGADSLKNWADYFLEHNPQLSDSDRKSAWSYAANVIGSQVGQNAPMLASMLIPGALAGRLGAGAIAGVERAAIAGLKAPKTILNVAEKATYELMKRKVVDAAVKGAVEKAVATKTRATLATAASMNGLMTLGSNTDELRAAMPGTPESTLLAISLPLTVLQSMIEVMPWGVETKTAKAIGKLAVGKALTTGVMRDATEAVIKPRIWGNIGKFGETWLGRTVATGAGETFEELLQQAATDISVNTFRTDSGNEQAYSGLLDNGGRILREAFLGGLALGVIPSTLNSMAASRRAAVIRDSTKEDLVKQSKVVQHQMLVDVQGPAVSAAFFDRMTQEFGKPAADILRNLAYNTAYIQVQEQQKAPAAQRKVVRPQDLFNDLTTLMVSDPERANTLRDTFLNKGVQAGVELINDWFPEIKGQMIHWADVSAIAELDRNHAGLQAEINDKAGIDVFASPESIQDGARQVVQAVLGGKAPGDYLYDVAKHAKDALGSQSRVIEPEFMADVLNRMGPQNARIAYALGWIRGVPAGEGKVAIRLEMDSKGRVGGVVYDDAQAEGLAKQVLRQKIEEPKGAIQPKAKGPGEQPVVPGIDLQANREPLALKMVESLRLGAIRGRLEDFDQATRAPAVAPVAKPAEVLASPAKQSSELKDSFKSISPGNTIKVLNKFGDEIADSKVAETGKDGVTLESGEAIPFGHITEYKDGVMKVDVTGGDVLAAPKKKAVKATMTGEPALYTAAYRLGIFFPNATADTFVHEIMHHLIQNQLLPLDIHQAFVNNFGVAANPGDEPILNTDGQENAANALLAYLRDNQLPANPEMAKAFGAIKLILQATPSIKQMALATTHTGVEATGLDLKLSSGLTKVLENLMSEVTPDRVAQIYGEGLEHSLGMNPGMKIVNEQEMLATARRTARASGVNVETYLAGVLNEMGEALDNKTSVSYLTLPQKLAVQQRVNQDFQKMYALDPKSKAEERPLFQAERDESGNYDMFFAEERHKDMRGASDVQKAKILWHELLVSDDRRAVVNDWKNKGAGKYGYYSRFMMDLLNNLEHVSDIDSMIALFGKSGAIVQPTAEFLASPATKNFEGMSEADVNRYAHSTAVFPDTKASERHQLLHDKAIELYNKGWSQLAIGQKMDVLRQIAPGKSEARVDSGLSKIIADATPQGIVNDLTSLNSDNIFTKASKFLADKSRHALNYIQNIRSWCNVISGNNPDSPLVRAIADPVSRGNDTAWTWWTEIAERIRTEMDALGRNFDTAYRQEKIADQSFARSQIAYYYAQANGGLDMGADSRVADIAVANGLGRTTAEALKVVREIVEFAKNDPDMMAFVDVTQKIMRETFEQKAAPVFKEVTGKDAAPIKGIYVTISDEKGNVTSEDQAAAFEHLGGLPPRAGLPSQSLKEFLHRGQAQGNRVDDDYYGLTMRHINAMLNYAAKAKNVRSILDALNSPALMEDHRQKFGNLEYLDTLKKLLMREMNPRGKLNSVSMPGDTVFRFLNGNAAKVFLSWNPGPLLNQFVSIPMFAATVPAKLTGGFIRNLLEYSGQLATHKLDITSTDAYKLVKKYSPDMLELRPSPDVQRINEVLEAKGVSGLMVGATWFNRLLDIGMAPLQFFDMLPRLTAWKTAFEGKLEMLEGTGMDQSTREQAAKSFADDAVNKSFNPASKTERGLLQSESGEMMKSTMLFTSQPFANCRWFVSDMVLPMLQAWKDGGPAGVMKNLKSNPQLFYKLGMGVMLPGLAMGALGRRRPQKDIKEVLTDAICFGILNTIPVLGHILWYNAALGFGGSGADFGGVHGRLISEVVKAIGDITGGKADFDTVRSAERSISMLTRIPDYPLRITHKICDKVFIKGEGGQVEKLSDVLELMFGKPQPSPSP